jgi:uncharacterized protein
MFQQVSEGIILKIKVIPKSSKTEIVGKENDEIKIRLAAIPDKGAANEELIRFLSKHLGIAKTKIQIIHGETSRHKKILLKEALLSDIQNL